MSWLFESSQEKKFIVALKRIEDEAFFGSGHLSRDVTFKKHQSVLKGKYFLEAIRELMGSQILTDYQFWDGFLQAATNTLDNPSISNSKNLYSYLDSLKVNWDEKKPLNKVLPGLKATVSAGGLFAGAGGFVLGSIYFKWVVLFSLGLALGPWGATALAVGLIILNLAIASYSGYQLYKNIRVCSGHCLKDISEFVEHVANDAQQSIREETQENYSASDSNTYYSNSM
ncbi:MAG: hypothetical protein H0U70_05585 [Tatlockia sp.]|nr:hypothetical protein [Tatlockia sp.]